MRTQLYFAYGMNTNLQQMAYRCPNAEAVGRLKLIGYKFIFRGVADAFYTGNPNDIIEGAVFKITSECELALDRLEGYPTFYTKAYEQVNYNGEFVDVMLYTMTRKSHGKFSDPSKHYWDMLHKGYEQFGMNHKQMYNGLPKLSKYRSFDKDVEAIRKERRKAAVKAALWNQ